MTRGGLDTESEFSMDFCSFLSVGNFCLQYERYIMTGLMYPFLYNTNMRNASSRKG